MSTFFKPTTLVGAIAVAMGFSCSTFAETQASADIVTLAPVVITATRSETKIEDVPARIDIISPQIVAQSPIAELPHLLMNDAAINMVQSGGFGQTASIFIRGTNSEHALILRDGARLNTASTGAASLSFLDTTDIKQIEVLKGPASVLYGTDAIGGVVQIISKTPKKTGAFVTGEIGEQSTYKAVVGADLNEDGIYAQIRGQRLETDGSKITDLKGANIQPASYEQKGFSAKFGVDKKDYAVSLDYNQNEGNSYYDAYRNDGSLISQDFKNEIINLRSRLNVTDSLELNTRLSQFKDDIQQNQSADFVESTTQEAELNARWKFTPHQNILVGVTHQKLTGDVLSYGSPYDENVDSTGYFIQHQLNNDNGLNTQLGVRVEDNEKYGSHTVAQAAIRYQLLPTTSIYANVGTAFKAPTLNDMYGYGGNPALDPEESISYEIGIDQKLNHNISTGISAYYTKIDHLIESKCVAVCDGDWVNTFPIYQNINIDKASMQGGEWYAKWQEDELFFKTAFNYVKAMNDDTDQELTRRPRRSLTFTTGLQNEVYGISASFSAKSKAKDYLQETPGYATVDLNGYWNVHPNVKVFANIENVGDVTYKTASYNPGIYYVDGGRLASAGVTFKY
ncbi:TonB-dependent receptor [Acinetobacter defluvii]|uniref:TonB-dependent receptor n=1 Tax=Acinetobacter defluvii TaxID=1871111 RepID=A0A2S2FAT9_9GAMM|nr:TonB-dependent receptor [Acinetobacter defluvii]AWL28073.1 TonB-dependent receptor [Acinetobacter defluvii]